MAKRPTPEVPADTATATATKTKAPRTPKAPKADAPADGEKQTRRSFGRGWLADNIESIVRKHAAGKLKGHEAGTPLTVSTLQGLAENTAGEMPSTGAISAVLVRWTEGGYIKSSGKPMAFVGFTAKYKDGTLSTFLDDQKAKKAKARKAVKDAKAPVAAAA